MPTVFKCWNARSCPALAELGDHDLKEKFLLKSCSCVVGRPLVLRAPPPILLVCFSSWRRHSIWWFLQNPCSACWWLMNGCCCCCWLLRFFPLTLQVWLLLIWLVWIQKSHTCDISNKSDLKIWLTCNLIQVQAPCAVEKSSSRREQ